MLKAHTKETVYTSGEENKMLLRTIFAIALSAGVKPHQIVNHLKLNSDKLFAEELVEEFHKSL